nr:uncharacterized protein LOC120966135 [Aegilops tauschii subsp. strangulata]
MLCSDISRFESLSASAAGNQLFAAARTAGGTSSLRGERSYTAPELSGVTPPVALVTSGEGRHSETTTAPATSVADAGPRPACLHHLRPRRPGRCSPILLAEHGKLLNNF